MTRNGFHRPQPTTGEIQRSARRQEKIDHEQPWPHHIKLQERSETEDALKSAVAALLLSTRSTGLVTRKQPPPLHGEPKPGRSIRNHVRECGLVVPHGRPRACVPFPHANPSGRCAQGIEHRHLS